MIVTTDEHEGWQVLSRAMLHINQSRDCYDNPWLITGILDHCRRMILREQFPDNVHIADLLQESLTRMAPILELARPT